MMLAPLREMQPPLPLTPAGSVMVAPGVGLAEEAEGGTVWLHGMVVATWAAGDEVGRRLAAVTLVETGAATQTAVAAAFGVDVSTVWRWRKDRAEAGTVGLAGAKPGPKGAWKVTDAMRGEIVEYDSLIWPRFGSQ